MNGKVTSIQLFLSLLEMTMSSGEVTINILKYLGNKSKTEDLEGDSDSEKWMKSSETFCGWEQIVRTPNFLRLLSCLT